MMADGALAKQMALVYWDEDEERCPQPEDEPLDVGHPAERFCLATPQGSVPNLPMLTDAAASSAAGSMDLVHPGLPRRDSPTTALEKDFQESECKGPGSSSQRPVQLDSAEAEFGTRNP